MNDLWPHQSFAISAVHDAEAEYRRICLCSPTGAGKSRICWELCRNWLHVGYNVACYTNRKMLIEQLAKTAQEFGLVFGIRSADALGPREMPGEEPMQLCSIQTEERRSLTKKVWNLHKAPRVIIDEAHLNSGAMMQEIVRRHIKDHDAVIVGLTATPIGIGHMYDHLIVAGNNSQLRECGALVPAIYKAINEPDTKKVRKEVWDLSEGDVRKVMNLQHIVGSVIESFNKFNPDWRPAIGFAPGVPDSIWLCEQFRKAGIEAAHIDGVSCCYKGERYDSDPDVRKAIMRDWRNGEIKIVWNRFVLREGIDAPFIEHMVLATIFGSLQSYLQSIGRGLRTSAGTGKTKCTIQDHGGNWWRHGSANADRHWELDYTEQIVQGLRQERLRNKIEKEPMRCPRCKGVLLTSKCSCGFVIETKSRPVIQEDGTLKEVGGDIFRPRYTKHAPNTRELWERMYFRSKNAKKPRTFRAAMGLFCHENGYYPPTDMPYMPTNERDMFRHVKDVPRSDLT